jgi:hypothetical protein
VNPTSYRILDWRIMVPWIALTLICILIALNLTWGGCAAN